MISAPDEITRPQAKGPSHSDRYFRCCASCTAWGSGGITALRSVRKASPTTNSAPSEGPWRQYAGAVACHAGTPIGSCGARRWRSRHRCAVAVHVGSGFEGPCRHCSSSGNPPLHGHDEYSGEDLPKSEMAWLKPGQSSPEGEETDGFRAMAGCDTFYRFENGKQRHEDRRNRGSRWVQVGRNKEAFITEVRCPAQPHRPTRPGPQP
jgi:hypothetical protein